jgi:hypothetical protein
MLPPNVAFSCTKVACPTIAPMGTICILFITVITWMNPSIQSAYTWRSVNWVGLTTAFTWAWGYNTHHWVYLHLLERIDISLPAGRRLIGVIEVILFTVCWLDPDGMSFRHDPLVRIGICYLPIKSETLNSIKVVKLSAVVQQPNLECNKCTVNEYILIIFELMSINISSPVMFNSSTEWLSKVGNSDIIWPFSEWGNFDTSAHTANISFSQMIYLLWHRADKGLFLDCVETYEMGAACTSLFISSGQ